MRLPVVYLPQDWGGEFAEPEDVHHLQPVPAAQGVRCGWTKPPISQISYLPGAVESRPPWSGFFLSYTKSCTELPTDRWAGSGLTTRWILQASSTRLTSSSSIRHECSGQIATIFLPSPRTQCVAF